MNEELSTTAREILNYLKENPHAQDTAEGILQWWLRDHSVPRHRGAVQEALDQLIARRTIIARVFEGSETTYKLNRKKP